jgi:hypothetical protein
MKMLALTVLLSSAYLKGRYDALPLTTQVSTQEEKGQIYCGVILMDYTLSKETQSIYPIREYDEKTWNHNYSSLKDCVNQGYLPAQILNQ